MLTLNHGISSHIKIRGFGILSENWNGACLYDVNHVFNHYFIASPLPYDRYNEEKNMNMFLPHN